MAKIIEISDTDYKLLMDTVCDKVRELCFDGKEDKTDYYILRNLVDVIYNNTYIKENSNYEF